ncbi:MAG: BamA/TamA family outer membrane protein [Neisseriaceae bacterium]|nr:MAG: BamA/TamA family outer membrane protein [Neisseriaceae bacterium]
MIDRNLMVILLSSIWLIFSGFDWGLKKSKNELVTPPIEEMVEAKYLVKIHVYPLEVGNADEEVINSISALLEEHLSIVNKSRQPDLDEEQEKYLELEAPKEINQILATEGYFDSRIKIVPRLNLGNKEYTIEVGLSEPVRIKNKLVVLSGAIEDDPSIQNYYQRINTVWALNVSDIFKQKLWSSSKKLILKEVRKNKYPLARIKDSYAQIDPNEHSALLSLDIESGNLIKFGEIKVFGVERYPESIVRNLAVFNQGGDYNEELLFDYKQQLEKDGHYSEVVVTPVFGQIENNEVPIFVYLKEQLKKSFGIELTYDSGAGFGTVLEYQYYNFLNRGYVSAISAIYNQYEQEVSLGVTQTKKSNGKFWTARTNYFKGSKNGLNTVLWSTGFWYIYTGKVTDTSVGLEYYQEKLKTKEERKNNNALLVTGQWKINRVETLLRPENGYYISAKVGSTLGVLSSSSVRRYEIDGDYYITPWQRNNGTFLFKAQAGYVSAKDPANVPDELKFKIGGPGSVRGYPVDSIGMKKGSYTLGGMVKVAATVEYQKPVTKSVSVAVFHDIGDVKNKLKDIKLKHGTGIGVRWFSVVAPLSFDVAYGHERRKVSWHLNLGARF